MNGLYHTALGNKERRSNYWNGADDAATNDVHKSHYPYKEERYYQSATGSTVYQIPLTRRRPAIMIEISPGESMPLLGADETSSAIETDFYTPAVCLCCPKDLFCIQDADYVLCPDCRVVSPLVDTDTFEPRGQGGVGFGFTYEQLNQWQEQILSQRRSHQSEW